MRGSGTSAVAMIQALGSRLQALHIHDNDKHHDSHQIPFSMNIDFVPIVKALKQIPRYGARNFYEALQFFRILHYSLWLEGDYHNTVGRFDKYMYLCGNIQRI
mgnify:CR=1 FL=1